MRLLITISVFCLSFGISNGQNLNRLIKQTENPFKKGYYEIIVRQELNFNRVYEHKAKLFNSKRKYVYISDSIVTINTQDTVLMVFVNNHKMHISAPLDLHRK